MRNCLVNGPITGSIIAGMLSETGQRTDSGGHSVFIGRVRADDHGGRIVVAIEYSAYDDMVNSEADRIMQEVMSEFSDITAIEIMHSIGIVRAGEASLLVVVSAGHRRQAMDGCSSAVELIKERLPVWKKEVFDDSSSEWKH